MCNSPLQLLQLLSVIQGASREDALSTALNRTAATVAGVSSGVSSLKVVRKVRKVVRPDTARGVGGGFGVGVGAFAGAGAVGGAIFPSQDGEEREEVLEEVMQPLPEDDDESFQSHMHESSTVGPLGRTQEYTSSTRSTVGGVEVTMTPNTRTPPGQGQHHRTDAVDHTQNISSRSGNSSNSSSSRSSNNNSPSAMLTTQNVSALVQEAEADATAARKAHAEMLAEGRFLVKQLAEAEGQLAVESQDVAALTEHNKVRQWSTR